MYVLKSRLTGKGRQRTTNKLTLDSTPTVNGKNSCRLALSNVICEKCWLSTQRLSLFVYSIYILGTIIVCVDHKTVTADPVLAKVHSKLTFLNATLLLAHIVVLLTVDLCINHVLMLSMNQSPVRQIDTANEFIWSLAVCAAGNFRCSSTGQCLPQSYRCDGTAQCINGEDERDCCEYASMICENSRHWFWEIQK